MTTVRPALNMILRPSNRNILQGNTLAFAGVQGMARRC